LNFAADVSDAKRIQHLILAQRVCRSMNSKCEGFEYRRNCPRRLADGSAKYASRGKRRVDELDCGEMLSGSPASLRVGPWQRYMLSTAPILPPPRFPSLWPPPAEGRLTFSSSSACLARRPGCWRASEPAARDTEPSSGSASLRCGLQQHRAKARCLQEARVSAAARGKHK